MRANIQCYGARRGRSFAAVWFVVALALLASCGASSGTPTVLRGRMAKSIPTLNSCVLDWNRGTLGEGRRAAAIDAVTGKAALMFAFDNGACGLAFPAHTTTATGESRGTYVTFFGGDFALGYSPLGFVKKSEIIALGDAAGKHTNVIVQRNTGRVVVSRQHGYMLTVPASVFTNPPSDCKHVVLPNSLANGRYAVLKTTTSCTMTRTLLWGWATERSPEHPESQYILGWACVGTEKEAGVSPVTYARVTCTSGANVVEAENELRQMWE